jgi:acetyltransferase-like isoleucine patch superfamily enzyme
VRSPLRTANRVPSELVAPAPDEFRSFGDGSWIVPPAEVVGADRIDVGAGVVLLEHASIVVAPGARLSIGDGARLARAACVVCATSVTIGALVSSSDHATVTDSWTLVTSSSAARVPPPAGGAVVIEDGAYLGFGSIVGPGVRVGAGAFVGDGAVVLDDVPAHTVVYGNPARVVRRLDAGEWIGPRFP